MCLTLKTLFYFLKQKIVFKNNFLIFFEKINIWKKIDASIIYIYIYIYIFFIFLIFSTIFLFYSCQIDLINIFDMTNPFG